MKPKTPQIIYAEVTSKQLRQIEVDGELQFCFPDGVTMKRKWGSKGFTLTCADKHVSDILVAGLDDTGLAWQVEEEFPEEKEKKKPIWERRKRGVFNVV